MGKLKSQLRSYLRPRFSLVTAVAATAFASHADAQISNIDVRFPNGTVVEQDPAAPGTFVSPFDNPVIHALYTLESQPVGLTSQRPNEFQWSFHRFGMWGTQSCPNGGTFCDASSSRNSFIVWPTLPGQVTAPTTMDVEFYGARVGAGATSQLHFAREIDTTIGEPPTSAQIGSVSVKLTPDTVIVPLNVVVVVPAASMSTERNRMQTFADEDLFRAYFDGRWAANMVRAPSALLENFGRWTTKAVPIDPDPNLRRVQRITQSGSTFFASSVPQLGPNPDDVFVQCGIQFRMRQFIVLEETDPVRVRRIQADTAMCENGGPFGGSGRALLRHYVQQAAPLLADPNLRTVVVANRVAPLDCFSQGGALTPCCDANVLGIESSGDVLIGIDNIDNNFTLGRQLTLTHELGHALGMGHLNTGCTNAATRNLMCDDPANVVPHIAGCEFRNGVPVSPLPPNCQPLNDNNMTASCTVARAAALAGTDPTPPVANAGPDQTIECTGPAGAAVTLSGQATDPETGIVSTGWTAPGDPATLPNPTQVTAPIGTTIYSFAATNNAGVRGFDQVNVTVRDTAAPVITPPAAISVMGCQPGGTTIAAPTVTDLCSAAVQVTGAVVETNGVPRTPLPIVNGQVTVDPGAHVVEWRAVDAAGNVSTARQTVNVAACLLAGESLSVSDGAEIRTPQGVRAPLANLGTGLLDVGATASVGAITSRGPVRLRDRSTVNGNVTSASSIERQNEVTVTGAVLPNTAVILPAAPALTSPWPATNQGDVTVFREQSRTLSPGSYASVNIMGGGSVTLSAGTYHFHRLALEPESIVRSTNATVIEIRDGWIHRSSFRLPNGQLATTTVNYRGTDEVALEVSHQGAVIAPNATLRLGANGELNFFGRYFARVLELRPRVMVRTQSAAADEAHLASITRSTEASQPVMDEEPAGGLEASCAMSSRRRTGGAGVVLAALAAILVARRRLNESRKTC